jgi:hypothetical protein
MSSREQREMLAHQRVGVEVAEALVHRGRALEVGEQEGHLADAEPLVLVDALGAEQAAEGLPRKQHSARTYRARTRAPACRLRQHFGRPIDRAASRAAARCSRPRSLPDRRHGRRAREESAVRHSRSATRVGVGAGSPATGSTNPAWVRTLIPPAAPGPSSTGSAVTAPAAGTPCREQSAQEVEKADRLAGQRPVREKRSFQWKSSTESDRDRETTAVEHAATRRT